MLRLAKRYSLDFIDYIYIFIGAFIVALAFQVYLLPNNLVTGGVSGLSVITFSLFNLDPALTQYALNIPLIIICYIYLGKAAGNKTVLGSLLVPFYLTFMGDFQGWTDDPFLAMVFGGVLTGVGLGIVFRAKASTGGTAIPIQIFTMKTGIPLGTSTLIIDGMVILLALLAFDLETVMYSVITLFIVSKVIDLVQVGISNQKNVFIISDNPKEISHEVMNTMRRGVTNLGIRGGYGDTDKDMLMVVIQEREFTFLRELILNVDEDAFVVVMSATEVLGRGFSLTQDYIPTKGSTLYEDTHSLD